MESFILIVGTDEYRISLSTADALAAEKQLGGISLMDAMDKADSVNVQQILLWAGLKKLNHGITLEKTASIMDGMKNGFTMDGVEFRDYSIDTRIKLALKILTVGGFFTEDTVQNIDAQIQTQDER